MDFGTKVLQELYDRFDSMCDDEYIQLLKQANKIENNIKYECDYINEKSSVYYNLIGESDESI